MQLYVTAHPPLLFQQQQSEMMNRQCLPSMNLNSNSKTLVLKDSSIRSIWTKGSSVRSIWTYLTASPWTQKLFSSVSSIWTCLTASPCCTSMRNSKPISVMLSGVLQPTTILWPLLGPLSKTGRPCKRPQWHCACRTRPCLAPFPATLLSMGLSLKSAAHSQQFKDHKCIYILNILQSMSEFSTLWQHQTTLRMH